MDVFRTYQEALNKLRTTRLIEPIAIFFEIMFMESKPVEIYYPLLRNALAFFKEPWTATYGAEVQVYAHDDFDLLGRTAAEWRTNILSKEALATHAAAPGPGCGAQSQVGK